MYKYILTTIFIFNISYGQIILNKVLNESWELSEFDFSKSIKTIEYKEKSAMGFTGYIIPDTMNSIPVDIGYFFNSDGAQTMRGISNKNKTEVDSKKLFDLLFPSLNKLFGDSISDKEMFGSRMIRWKYKGYKIIIMNYGSDTCMLSIIR